MTRQQHPLRVLKGLIRLEEAGIGAICLQIRLLFYKIPAQFFWRLGEMGEK
jgi:hypothetical protein